MPGQWARLSNISEDGKCLRTETFRIGSKEVVHTKGASAGRALEAYRKVRKSHPELVAQLDIMSQPASNVDSVILSWVIEGQHPCSMWQRDCFSSVFADSAVQSMGSRRIPPQWFQDRLKWLEPSGCPRKADWSLSDSAKTISDLQRWDYYNPEKDAQNDLEEGPELDGDLALELAANAENCLSLSLHPRLRRAALRQAAEEGFAEQRKTRQGNLSNRAEALLSIVPQAQGKKGSAKTSKPSATSKPSIKDKPSAKSKLSKHLKPSAKTKPSLSKKAQKKQVQRPA